MSASKQANAPGKLELVREFVNTLDLEDGTDELGTPAALRDWLAARGLLEPDATAGPAAVERAHELREALRDLMEANLHPVDHAGAGLVLDEAARRARLAVCSQADGEALIEPRASGVDAALGRLIVHVVHAKADGTWERLKACGNPTCRYAFYDHTKNHSGRWCSMASCGNRAKAQAYRARRAASAENG